MVSLASHMRITALDRRLGALAVPALGALVSEPIFVLTDTAMVGHLGATALGGMSVGSTIIQTVIGLCIFLSYTTTPVVSRRLGAGDEPGAVRGGIEGMWLGLGLGVVLLVAGLPLARPVTALFAGDGAVADQGYRYLSICLWGLPGMLMALAAVGLFRGLQDTKTPLVVAAVGSGVNIVLNWVFIFPLDMGITGSGLGTAITQNLMALAYVVIAVRAAKAHHVSLSIGLGEPGQALISSALMFLRSLTLRIVMLVVVGAAARLGTYELAALQVTMSLYSLLVNTLDALAIASQTIIAHDLGAGDSLGVRRQLKRIVGWGIIVGVVLTIAVLALSGVAGQVFTSDPAVRALLPISFIMLALFLPMCGVLFVLDGVLIGSGDVYYLAFAGLIPLVTFVGAVAGVLAVRPSGSAAMVWLWLAYFGAFMIARLIVLIHRARGNAWLVVGHDR